MRRFLPMLPLAVLLVPFLAGVALTAVQSFGFGLPGVEAPTLTGWRALLSGPTWESLVYGVRVAGVSSLVSVGAGALLGYGVWRLPHRWHWAGLMGRIPLILPHIAVAWLVVLLCARSGLFSALAYATGLIEGQADFPALLYGGDGTGMVLAYVWKETPFVMLLTVASLRRLDPRLIELGRMLGGGRWRTFRAVVLPHVLPVLYVSLLILFLYALGAVEIPFVLGETRPVMPGMAAYDGFFHGGLAARPAALALLTALFAGGVGCVATFAVLTRGAGGVGMTAAATAGVTEGVTGKVRSGGGVWSPALFAASLVVLFGVPVLVLAVQAVAPAWAWPDLLPQVLSPRTLHWLAASWPTVARHLAWSAWYAGLATALCLAVCLLPARALAFGTVPAGPLAEGLLLAPALLPVMGFALGLHGVFVRVGLADSTAAVVLVLAAVSYPYMLRSLMAGWRTVGPDYARCAANLGAKPLRILLTVELPLLLPAAVAGGSVVFLVAFSDYFLVYLVGGGLVPSFTGYLFPVLQSGDRALGALLTLVFMVVPVVLFVVAEGLTMRFMRRRGMG